LTAGGGAALTGEAGLALTGLGGLWMEIGREDGIIEALFCVGEVMEADGVAVVGLNVDAELTPGAAPSAEYKVSRSNFGGRPLSPANHCSEVRPGVPSKAGGKMSLWKVSALLGTMKEIGSMYASLQVL